MSHNTDGGKWGGKQDLPPSLQSFPKTQPVNNSTHVTTTPEQHPGKKQREPGPILMREIPSTRCCPLGMVESQRETGDTIKQIVEKSY